MEKKFINRILILSSLIILIVIGVFIFNFVYPTNENPGCATKDVINFNRTESISFEKQKGKIIFNSNCVACHKINAKSTPDFIKNILDRIPNEKYFEQFIRNEDSLLKAKNKRVEKLREEFPNDFVHNFKLTNEEIESLKEYIK